MGKCKIVVLDFHMSFTVINGKIVVVDGKGIKNFDTFSCAEFNW